MKVDLRQAKLEQEEEQRTQEDIDNIWSYGTDDPKLAAKRQQEEDEFYQSMLRGWYDDDEDDLFSPLSMEVDADPYGANDPYMYLDGDYDCGDSPYYGDHFEREVPRVEGPFGDDLDIVTKKEDE